MDSIKAAIREIGRQRPLLTLNLEVFSIADLSFGFRRLILRGREIDGYLDPLAADGFKVMIPPFDALDRKVEAPERDEQGLPVWPDRVEPQLRALTVRSLDRARQLMTVDVCTHSDGLLNRWLSVLVPGDNVSLSGMRVEWFLPAEIERLVLIADESGVAALASIVESLPVDLMTTATQILVPESAREYVEGIQAELPKSAVTYLPNLTGSTENLITTGGGRTQVWIAAETAAVQSLRSTAKYEWNVDPRDLLARAYWHRTLNASAVDARDLERYRKALDEGADIHDPQLAEDLSLKD